MQDDGVGREGSEATYVGRSSAVDARLIAQRTGVKNAAERCERRLLKYSLNPSGPAFYLNGTEFARLTHSHLDAGHSFSIFSIAGRRCSLGAGVLVLTS